MNIGQLRLRNKLQICTQPYIRAHDLYLFSQAVMVFLVFRLDLQQWVVTDTLSHRDFHIYGPFALTQAMATSPSHMEALNIFIWRWFPLLTPYGLREADACFSPSMRAAFYVQWANCFVADAEERRWYYQQAATLLNEEARAARDGRARDN
jgi:hypothetical protein